MIEITKDPNADSRTSKENLKKEELQVATERHVEAVSNGLNFFADLLHEAGKNHDNTKLSSMNDFFEALTSGKIKESDWYHKHVTKERHHLKTNVPKDVTLVDVMECLVDCTMAGLGRSGEVYDIDISTDVLLLAVTNTVDLLKKNVKVIKSDDILDAVISDKK